MGEWGKTAEGFREAFAEFLPTLRAVARDKSHKLIAEP
jgi:hypothetical protein